MDYDIVKESAGKAVDSNGSSIHAELNMYDNLNSEMKEMISLLGNRLSNVLNREEAATDPNKPTGSGHSDIGDNLARCNSTYRERIDTLRYLMNRIDL